MRQSKLIKGNSLGRVSFPNLTNISFRVVTFVLKRFFICVADSLLLCAEPLCPTWPESDETARRRLFCRRAEGYGNVCACANPAPISFRPQSVSL